MNGILENQLFSELTTLRLGGEAKFLAKISSAEDLRRAADFALKRNLPLFILGGGSNLLVRDQGFNGMVAKMEIDGIEFVERGEEVEVLSGAGVLWDDLVAQAVERGLFGLENLSGIPGTVGGAVVQNIGAYGAGLSDRFLSAETFDAVTGQQKIFQKDDCFFSYRASIFKKPDNRQAIVRVRFLLKKKGGQNLSYPDLKNFFGERAEPSLKQIREAVIDIRSGKFPDLKTFGTAGSFFKNPVVSLEKLSALKERFPELPNYPAENNRFRLPLGFLLEKLGLRGARRGNVGSHEKQALVFVTLPGATASEFLKFVKECERKIFEECGIEIEPEVVTL